jgi:hypothetical protein
METKLLYFEAKLYMQGGGSSWRPKQRKVEAHGVTGIQELDVTELRRLDVLSRGDIQLGAKIAGTAGSGALTCALF